MSNGNFITNMSKYISYIEYSLTINEKMLLLFIGLIFVFIRIAHINGDKDDKFIIAIITIPSLIFFLVTVKLTSFQELRYIMPVIPFMCITIYFILDKLINVKHKNIIFIVMSLILTINGFILSEPKYLYKNYNECMTIAKENSEKSFVYVYDNFFNHMQSIPEMMIYNKTLIINTSKNEEDYLLNDSTLNEENSYILCIKSYMDNDEILNKIKEKTEFHNITVLCTNSYGHNDEQVENNLYLVSK